MFSTKKLRIIFAGTPEFAAHHLRTLLFFNYQIVGVFTQPDRPVGRGKKMTPTPVKILAEKHKLPIFQPISLCKKEIQQLIFQLNADIMVVVAYGLILPQMIFEMLRFGCINVHGSLLPRWRGAAPIQRSICAGDTETGITVIQINNDLDAGNILYKLSCPITTNDTSSTLCFKLANLGSIGLVKTLRRLINNNLYPKKQDDKLVTYAKKLSKEEAEIDWSLPAIQIERCVRAFNPWPVSWFKINNQLIKVWKTSVIKSDLQIKPGTIIGVNKYGIQVATANDVLNLELLQPANKKIINAYYLSELLKPGNHLI